MLALSETQQKALQILKVSGKRIVKVVPLPTAESVLTVPRISLISERTTSIPTPRPEISSAWSLIAKTRLE